MGGGISRRGSDDVRDGNSPFARWRQDELHVHYEFTEATDTIFRLDRAECAHEHSGIGYSVRVSEYLPGNVKPSASLPFCYRPGGE